jgi:uncharacterized integral membrane protein
MSVFFRWILGLAITAAAVLFAVANRAPVPVTWSPVNPPLPLPACALALGGAAIGFLAGAVFAWLNTGSLRREWREQKKKISRLEQRGSEDNDIV